MRISNYIKGIFSIYTATYLIKALSGCRTKTKIIEQEGYIHVLGYFYGHDEHRNILHESFVNVAFRIVKANNNNVFESLY